MHTTQHGVNIDTAYPSARHLCYFHETAEALQDFDVSCGFFSSKLAVSMSLADKVVYLLVRYGDILLHGTRAFYRAVGANTRAKNGFQCTALGPLCDASHFEQVDRLATKRRLGLLEDCRSVVVTSGSLGGAFVTRAAKVICARMGGPLNLVAVCGRDAEAAERVRRLACDRKDIRVVALPFVGEMNEVLAIADCVVMRPSPGIMHESLVRKVPLVAFARVSGADKGSVSFMRKHELGEVFWDWSDVPGALTRVLANRAEYQRNIERFLAPYPHTYEHMSRVVADVIRESLESRREECRTNP